MEFIMADYIISGCSIADLSEEHFKKRDIEYVCFHYSLDGVQYMDDLGKTMSIDNFYAAMQNGAETKTSQVSAGEFMEYFKPFLEAGKDIIHVCISSGISGTFNAANVAKEMLEEQYPDRKIYIIDSLTASSGVGLLLDKMADLRDEGYTENCYLSHSACFADAEAVAKLVNEKIPGTQGKTVINNIGTTIGSHTGPGTVALFFWGDKRVD